MCVCVSVCVCACMRGVCGMCLKNMVLYIVQWYQTMAFVELIFFIIFFSHTGILHVHFFVGFILIFFKQSKTISMMVCVVASLRVFHKALKEKKISFSY